MPQKNLLIIIVSILLTAIIVGGVVYFWQSASFAKEKQQLEKLVQDLNNQIQNLQNQANKPIDDIQEQVYETNYLKVMIPTGWTATIAKEMVEEIVDENGNSISVQPNPAAVNITKDNYILYINTQAQQASGVEGGRFSEIAQGAPSADAVIKIHPTSPCGSSEKGSAFDQYQRVDLYVSSQEKNIETCNIPTGQKTVWYFSYITGNSKGGYFNYYTDASGKGLVITMAYDSDNVNQLPIKDSAVLTQMLETMTDIAATLEIKQK